MSEYLEVWVSGDVRVAPLGDVPISIGRGDGRDIRLDDEPTVSRLHAVVERIGSEWSVRDLGSQNGTFVNGRLVTAGHPLRSRDEIRIGSAKLVFRTDSELAMTPPTSRAEPAPDLTRREREVLIELCRPLISGRVFAEPASVAAIAEALFVSEAAVRQHLGNLYDKFLIPADSDRRRSQLADAAIVRAAVNMTDLRAPGS